MFVEVHKPDKDTRTSKKDPSCGDTEAAEKSQGDLPTTSLTQGISDLLVSPLKMEPLRTSPDEHTLQDKHLQQILEEYNKQTANFSESEKAEIFLQLPYIAVGFFTYKGGYLSLDKYDVHLYIPRGAIPEGELKQVYIYVDPDVPPVDLGDGEEDALSPVIQCGPPCLTFLDSVVLSFPHHANDTSEWKLSAQMCTDDDASQTWKVLDSSTGGKLVSSKGDKAIFLVNHFTKFALIGRPLHNSGIRVQVGAFGDIFKSTQGWYTFRIYVWKNDAVSKQKVLDMKERLESEILDAFRDLVIFSDKGDMSVEISKIMQGWGMQPICQSGQNK